MKMAKESVSNRMKEVNAVRCINGNPNVREMRTSFTWSECVDPEVNQ